MIETIHKKTSHHSSCQINVVSTDVVIKKETYSTFVDKFYNKKSDEKIQRTECENQNDIFSEGHKNRHFVHNDI